MGAWHGLAQRGTAWCVAASGVGGDRLEGWTIVSPLALCSSRFGSEADTKRCLVWRLKSRGALALFSWQAVRCRQHVQLVHCVKRELAQQHGVPLHAHPSLRPLMKSTRARRCARALGHRLMPYSRNPFTSQGQAHWMVASAIYMCAHFWPAGTGEVCAQTGATGSAHQRSEAARESETGRFLSTRLRTARLWV